METAAANTMADLLAQAQLLFTWVMTNIATLATTILANPILLFGFLITLVGLCVGIFKRLSNIG